MILQDAADRRMALAVHWFSATQVNAKLSELSLSGRCTASRLRRDGELLGAYVMQPAPGYRYPPWQLSSDGRPVDFLGEILKVLRGDGPFSCKQGDLHRSTGFHGSLRDNLNLEGAAWRDEELLEALDAVGMGPFVRGNPLGLDQLVMGNGSLSGGQRQAIGLARVILQDPPVVLLDESTAAFDQQSETHVIQFCSVGSASARLY
ncbi:ATP-binding cassette domain-containing protein [Stenotrophomonas maltophilia]|uniref:ATP-binding cassette domain-containing protein n=1 Tax=Stenotrophomonas maltophilia TaxID=40324 RepID=UPI0021BECC8E|nr:ATP-binding cassette domain-containing protein [Stenotrophomonas maltophilia]UXL29519.1 ATP-binding cassette domain-containing protein [Stenotrophomonas maltophilia]